MDIHGVGFYMNGCIKVVDVRLRKEYFKKYLFFNQGLLDGVKVVILKEERLSMFNIEVYTKWSYTP